MEITDFKVSLHPLRSSKVFKADAFARFCLKHKQFFDFHAWTCHLTEDLAELALYQEFMWMYHNYEKEINDAIAKTHTTVVSFFTQLAV